MPRLHCLKNHSLDHGEGVRAGVIRIWQESEIQPSLAADTSMISKIKGKTEISLNLRTATQWFTR
jgi:hypothetical protein